MAEDKTIIAADGAGDAGANAGAGAGDVAAAAGNSSAGGDASAGGTAGQSSGSGSAAGGAAKKTILADGGTDKGAGQAGDWPADWRAKIAGDDKKLLGQLERFGSPTDLAKKIREQEVLISQGKQKAGLPKDATAEQIAAYRKENGIPETADKYDLALPDGMVIGEADKPIVDSLLKTMHGINLNNDQVKQVMAAYYAQEKEFLVGRDAQIAETKIKQDDLLHKDWGQEYRPNLNAISSLVKTFSTETRNALAGSVDSDGMPLLNNPSFLKDMAVLARTINPIDTVVGTGAGSQMSSVEDEIKTIEKRMKEDRNGYFKDQPMQDRYLKLIDWKDRQGKKKP